MVGAGWPANVIVPLPPFLPLPETVALCVVFEPTPRAAAFFDFAVWAAVADAESSPSNGSLFRILCMIDDTTSSIVSRCRLDALSAEFVATAVDIAAVVDVVVVVLSSSDSLLTEKEDEAFEVDGSAVVSGAAAAEDDGDDKEVVTTVFSASVVVDVVEVDGAISASVAELGADVVAPFSSFPDSTKNFKKMMKRNLVGFCYLFPCHFLPTIHSPLFELRASSPLKTC